MPLRDRRGETLFIDARQMGAMIDRTHRELTAENIGRIAGTYHAWKGMTNDELRMTNEESGIRHSSFVIRHSSL